MDPTEVGVAAGMAAMVRGLGPVFGIAVLAAVFAARGGYGSPSSFAHGFSAAIAVGAAPALAGAAAGTAVAARRQTDARRHTSQTAIGDP